MHHGQDLDAIVERNVIEYMLESPETHGTNVSPDDPVHLGHRLNSFENFPHTRDEPISKANLNRFVRPVSLPDVGLRSRPYDDWQTHDVVPKSSSASRHGRPSPGLA